MSFSGCTIGPFFDCTLRLSMQNSVDYQLEKVSLSKSARVSIDFRVAELAWGEHR